MEIIRFLWERLNSPYVNSSEKKPMSNSNFFFGIISWFLLLENFIDLDLEEKKMENWKKKPIKEMNMTKNVEKIYYRL